MHLFFRIFSIQAEVSRLSRFKLYLKKIICNRSNLIYARGSYYTHMLVVKSIKILFWWCSLHSGCKTFRAHFKKFNYTERHKFHTSVCLFLFVVIPPKLALYNTERDFCFAPCDPLNNKLSVTKLFWNYARCNFYDCVFENCLHPLPSVISYVCSLLTSNGNHSGKLVFVTSSLRRNPRGNMIVVNQPLSCWVFLMHFTFGLRWRVDGTSPSARADVS